MKKNRIKALAFALCLTGSLAFAAFSGQTPVSPVKVQAEAVNQSVDAATVWKYLDDGSDPAKGGNDRLAWARAGFDDSKWKSAKGTFGSKRGTNAFSGNFTADTVLAGCDGVNDVPAYFFRTTLNVDDITKVSKLTGSIFYDDGVILYINGVRVAASPEMSAEPTGNQVYGGDNAGGDPRTLTIDSKDLSMLKNGQNVIAAEVHNGRQTSSDIWFSAPEIKLTMDTSAAGQIEQSNIVVNTGADQSSVNFTWYANAQSEASVYFGKYADVKALADSKEKPDGTKVRELKASSTATDKSGWFSCKAGVDRLEAGVQYGYMLVNSANGENTVSQVKSFNTTPKGSFTFAYAGDPQIGAGSLQSDSQGWDKTLNIIKNSKEFSGTDFLFSAGDQINDPRQEAQFDGYTNHDVIAGLPQATTIGDHDNYYGSTTYQQHFNVSGESGKGATQAGSDYYFVYNNTLFMVLNSNSMSTAEHKVFMQDAIEKTRGQDIKWKIVEFHHSIYSIANHAVEADILQRRQELVPVFKELDIDVVLMGHDHVYCRTYMMDGDKPMTDASIYDKPDYSSITNPTGILYVTANSASGSKFYTIQNREFPYARVMNQERVPNISRVDISDNLFKITTYRTTDMSVVDTFAINRAPFAIDTSSKSEYGTYSADKASAEAGETVKLTAEPAEGHELDSWKVTDKDGNQVEVSEDGSFVMPNGPVKAEAVFKPAYRIIEGDGQTVTPGREAVFRANGAMVTCTGVSVDGKELEKDSDYSLASGSTIVTLSKDYTESLEEGSHDLAVEYPDGKANGTFQAVKAAETAEENKDSGKGSQTGDDKTGSNAEGKTAAGTGKTAGTGSRISGGGSNGSNGGKTASGGFSVSSGTAAKTGDNSQIMLYLLVEIGAAAAAIAVIMLYIRRTRW